MATKELPDPELLRKLLRYEPETGKLFWLLRPLEMFPDARAWKIWNTRFAQKSAFEARGGAYGHLMGTINYRHYYAHRVAWAMHYGQWPNGEIDHINGSQKDNRITNLRCVTRGENSKNLALARNNTSGTPGVRKSPSPGKWKAEIKVNSKAISLGTFATKEDAIAARKAAEKLYGFHKNHGAR